MNIYPALTYRDVRTAIAWLETAFGLQGPDLDDTDSALDHAVLTHGSGMVMIESERPDDLHGSHTGMGWIYVVIDDMDIHYQRAKAAGAEMLGEPHDSGLGFRGFSARDLEGDLWSFGTEA